MSFRMRVHQRLKDADFEPVSQEQFEAHPLAPKDSDRIKIEDCDMFVGIVAKKYGKPGEDGISFTDAEYRSAQAFGLPCLIFLLDKRAHWPIDRVDEDQSRVNEFRARLEEDRTAVHFQSEDELASECLKAVKKHRFASTVLLSCSRNDYPWAAELAEKLQGQLVSRGQRRLEVVTSQQFKDQTEALEAAEGCAAFISAVSRDSQRDADWRTLLERAGTRPARKSGAAHAVPVTVAPTPLARAAVPPLLRDARVLWYGGAPSGEELTDSDEAALSSLAKRTIWEARGPGSIAVKPSRTVFLADVSLELVPERNRLRTRLEDGGFRVLPEGLLSENPIKFEAELDQLLQQSDLVVRLLSEKNDDEYLGYPTNWREALDKCIACTEKPAKNWATPATPKEIVDRYLADQSPPGPFMEKLGAELKKEPSIKPAIVRNGDEIVPHEGAVFVTSGPTDRLDVQRFCRSCIQSSWPGSVPPDLSPEEERERREVWLKMSKLVIVLYFGAKSDEALAETIRCVNQAGLENQELRVLVVAHPYPKADLGLPRVSMVPLEKICGKFQPGVA